MIVSHEKSRDSFGIWFVHVLSIRECECECECCSINMWNKAQYRLWGLSVSCLFLVVFTLKRCSGCSTKGHETDRHRLEMEWPHRKISFATVFIDIVWKTPFHKYWFNIYGPHWTRTYVHQNVHADNSSMTVPSFIGISKQKIGAPFNSRYTYLVVLCRWWVCMG